jgi:MoxR-like ATPase
MKGARRTRRRADMTDRGIETFARALQERVGRILRGKAQCVHFAVVTLIARGHLLIEDRPGVGKTLLARALARALDLPFQRVQCTSDLLPTDILGAQVYHPTTGEVTFRPGPVFAAVLLADELNRTPPRTQSALLECMQERRVTVDRTSHALPDPFFVVATQNPLSFAGTYPLPESQLDRFLMRIRIGYPDRDDELEIVALESGHEALGDLEPLAGRDDLAAAQRAMLEVRLAPDLAAYIVELARRTRALPDVRLGVSTRGAQALHRAARARAVVMGRDYVVPDDIQVLAQPVFAHRLQARGGDGDGEAILAEILQTVDAPD